MLPIKTIQNTTEFETGLFIKPKENIVLNFCDNKSNESTNGINKILPLNKQKTELSFSSDLELITTKNISPVTNDTRQKVENRKAKISEVNGSVLEVEEFFVICNIYLDDLQKRKMKIRLARSIFPTNIHYGSPIVLSYHQNEDGFKSPQIRLRKIDFTPEMEKQNNEIDNIIESF